MAQTVILEKRVLSFVFFDSLGAWSSNSNPALFVPEVGVEYSVYWDGNSYSCIGFTSAAIPDNYLLGNPLPAGGADNGIPFLMSAISDGSGMSIMTFDQGDTHEVGIYKVEEDAEPPSADVKIKGYSGSYLNYEKVPKVWLAAPESTEDNPVLVPFTYGEALDDVEITPDFSAGDQKITLSEGYMARSAVVKKPATLTPANIKAGEQIAGIIGEYEGEVPETEEKTVAADFSGGDMILEPTEGKYLSKATVTKPDTLIPENIAAGVNIAGIVGSLTGGSDVKITSGNFRGSTSGGVPVSHGLGKMPDIVIVYTINQPSSASTGIILQATGMTTTFYNKSGASSSFIKQGGTAQSGATKIRLLGNSGIETTSASNQANSINKATANEFYVGNTTYKTGDFDYAWIAIAGLT